MTHGKPAAALMEFARMDAAYSAAVAQELQC
jgi:hypothetical protein